MVEFMSTFFLYNSQPRHRLNYDAVTALVSCVRKDNAEDSEFSDWIPLPTGSVAELYLQPLISCIGDYDTMYYGSGDLAIPEGYPPPTQLPAEFDRVVFVHEIIDSEFPSYVYLIHAYTLAESDNGEYIAIKFPGELCQLYVSYILYVTLQALRRMDQRALLNGHITCCRLWDELLDTVTP